MNRVDMALTRNTIRNKIKLSTAEILGGKELFNFRRSDRLDLNGDMFDRGVFFFDFPMDRLCDIISLPDGF